MLSGDEQGDSAKEPAQGPVKGPVKDPGQGRGYVPPSDTFHRQVLVGSATVDGYGVVWLTTATTRVQLVGQQAARALEHGQVRVTAVPQPDHRDESGLPRMRVLAVEPVVRRSPP